MLRKNVNLERWLCSFLAAGIQLLIGTSPLSAAPNSPPPIPGWTHSEDLSRDTAERHGVVLAGRDVTISSPVIAEIDGVTENGKEVAVGGADGTLYVYRAEGSLLWQADLPNKSCQFAGSNNKLLSSPVVGELFGDGVPYVVIGYGGVHGKSCPGGVVALRGTNGTTLWHFSIKKFDKRNRIYGISYSVFSSPALADVDHDGKLEVGFGAFDRNVYLLNANGSVRWYYQAADTVWSSPAFANVDNDPNLEMIIGTDISQNKQIRPPTINGGYVYAFKTAKRKSPRINFRDKSAYVWQASFDQVIYSSPVIADVLPSSPGLEVVVGSGCYFPERTSNKGGKWYKVLRLKDGKLLRTLPVQACSSSQAAVADLDGDGTPEVITSVNGVNGGDGNGRLIAWNAETVTKLWDIVPRVRGANDETSGNFMSPIVADLDGNGSAEVVINNGSGVAVIEGPTGVQLTCGETSCDDGAIQLNTWKKLFGTPAIGDINNDGELDLVAAGGHASLPSHGMIYGWTGFSSVLGSTPGAGAPFQASWPQFRGNQYHTAILP